MLIIQIPPLKRDFLLNKEMKKRVTIQGVNGCFHDAAARAFFAGEDIEVVPCETFNSMFDVLNVDSSLIGIMAI